MSRGKVYFFCRGAVFALLQRRPFLSRARSAVGHPLQKRVALCYNNLRPQAQSERGNAGKRSARSARAPRERRQAPGTPAAVNLQKRKTPPAGAREGNCHPGGGERGTECRQRSQRSARGAEANEVECYKAWPTPTRGARGGARAGAPGAAGGAEAGRRICGAWP